MIEYGIVHRSTPEELHRGPMSQVDALNWVAEFINDGGKLDAFLVVWREVSSWSPLGRVTRG